MAYSVNERTSAKYSADIVDQDGAAVPVASITTITLTLLNAGDLSVINSRDDQNIKNANGVTIDSAGHLIWIMVPADNAIVDDDTAVERHIAIFKVTWASGSRGLVKRVEFDVTNMQDTP